ncbi:NAD-P-binding protein [Clavulina sp. PMI_390]|nr:NAD-P-binding protein [Clavulina sp. PMI_390]
MSKIIAVIGATGAQGTPIVKDLLKPCADGSPSPYKVRALTRNPEHRRAKELEALGAELVQGSFTDFDSIHRLFEGCYGAFVNTDSFTVGAAVEINAAFNIYEIAMHHKLRHYVWSNLDYSLRLGGWDPMYSVDHHNTKARFGEWMMAQPNPIDGEGMMWTSFTTAPYMDMMYAMFAPVIQDDGTRLWVSPMGNGGMLPLAALDDLGWWGRWTFDNPSLSTGRDLALASQCVTMPEMVEIFHKVTGLPVKYQPLTMEEYFKLFNGKDVPVAFDVKDGKSWESNFHAWWSMWRDGITKRDMKWIESIHPPTTLENWMREHKYDGTVPKFLLKNSEDHRGNPLHLKFDKSTLLNSAQA